MALALWSHSPAPPTVPDVPKIRDEDRRFAERLGGVLRDLRSRSGWTREEAAEKIGVNAGTLGRWERAEYSPKGYDLGRLYRGYVTWGAQWEWFFDPPERVEINPVRARLDELERAGAIAADEREARVANRRQQAVAKRAAARDKSSTRSQPRSPRQPPAS